MREKKTLMSVALILQKWSEQEIKRKNESRPGCSAAFTNLHNYTILYYIRILTTVDASVILNKLSFVVTNWTNEKM